MNETIERSSDAVWDCKTQETSCALNLALEVFMFHIKQQIYLPEGGVSGFTSTYFGHSL